MIAPPSKPAATPAATPRCALAGVAASEPAIVATATKAANVFFMFWALLGWRLRAPGLGLTHTLFRTAASLKSAHGSIESKRSQSVIEKNGFFGPKVAFIPEKQAPIRDAGRN